MFVKNHQTVLQNFVAIIVLFSMLLSSVQPVFAQDATPETPVPTETGQVPTEEVITEVPTDEPTTAPTEEATESPTEAVTETPTEVPTEVLIPTEVVTETPVVDITPPAGTITVPLAGTFTASPLLINVEANDTESGVAKVEFYASTVIPAVDWTLIGVVETAPYTFAWDWSAYEDGDVLLSATVYDLAGNSTVVSNLVEVTLEHPISAQAVPSNDNMANAIEIVIGMKVIQETGENTIEAGEPDNLCTRRSYGSVWYKFTPATTGVYTFNTIGTNYEHSIAVYQGSDMNFEACDVNAIYMSEGRTAFAYYAEAGVEYLVAVSSIDNEGGILNLRVNPLACPTGALCSILDFSTIRRHYIPSQKNFEMKLLDSNNNLVATTFGIDGTNTVLDSIPAGHYKLVATGYDGFMYFNDDVSIPGVINIDDKGMSFYDISMKDKNGNMIQADRISLSKGNDYFSSVRLENDEPLKRGFYATHGLYSIQASSVEAKTLIALNNFSLPDYSINLDLDVSKYNSENYTFHLDGISIDTFYIHNLPGSSYWGDLIQVTDGDTVSVVAPNLYETDIQLYANSLQMTNVNDLGMRFSSGGHTFTGDNDAELTFGGGLTLDIEFFYPAYNLYDNKPYQLGWNGFITAVLQDAHGNRVVSSDNNDGYQNYQYTIKDATNSVVAGSFVDGWNNMLANYQFPISATKKAGNWHATARIDTGDLQGMITKTEDFVVITPPIPNDNIANARAITLTNNAFTVTNLDTRGASVEGTEPYRTCNGDTTGSVWYKFTPTVTGIYSIDTHGSNYQHSISIFKNDTVKTHLSCYDTDADPSQGENDPNGTPMAYQFTANQSYLIGFSDRNGGGNLTFTMKKVTCPAGALCVTGNGENKWAERYIEVKVLDASNNLVAESWGDGLGYTVVSQTIDEKTIKPGKYKVITSAWGFYIVKTDVTIPGTLYVDADKSPRIEFNIRDNAGNLFEPDETIVAYTPDVIASPHPFMDNEKVFMRMTPGTYGIQLSSQSGKTVLAKPNVNVMASAPVDFDARNMDTEQYTFHLDGITADVSYQQDMPGGNYWGNLIPIENGDTVTVGMPENFIFRPELGFNIDDWWYAFSLNKHTFTGDSDITATLGGSLTPELVFDDAPYRSGDEKGAVWLRAHDENDFYLEYASNENGNVITSYEIRETATNNPVADSTESGLGWLADRYTFEIPTEVGIGDWTVTGTYDVGPYQSPSILTDEAEVPVYSAAPNANDEITDAEVIAGLPYSIEGYDITGSTTAADDPTLGECGVGQGVASVWYQYFPTQSGLISVDTIGSDFDTVLAVWEYTPGGLNLVGCSDDIDLGIDQDSQLEVAVRSGTTYYIEAMEGDSKISIQQLGGLLNLHITQGDYCYELATGLNLKAGGTISVSPPPNCLGNLYRAGTEITSLTVTPKTGYTFKYWADGGGTNVSETNPLTTIVMNQDQTYTAMLLIKPGLPTLVSPAAGALVANYTPTLNWSDSVPPADHYSVQIATNAAFNTNLVIIPDLIDSAYTVETALTPNTTYYWRVKAYGLDEGAESLWTAARTFRTKLVVPGLSKPEVEEAVKTTRPKFEWIAVAGTNSYTLQISKNANFATPVLTYTVTGTSFTPAVDLTPKGQELYWRVRANGTNAGDYSLAWKFTSANPPAIPVQVSPLTGTLLADYLPTLTWKVGTGGTVTAASYTLQIAKDSKFTIDMVEYPEIVALNKIMDALQDNKTYYWRVRSVAADGDLSLWSTSRTIRTRMLSPVLTAPIAGIETHTNRPTFQWGVVPGATSYTLLVAENDLFTLGLKTFTTSYTSYTPSVDLARSKTLHWKVRANGTNTSQYSGSDTFVTGNPPAIPVLVSPASGAVLSDTTPTVTWKAGAILVPAATGYEVEIASNSSFTADEAKYVSSTLNYTLLSELAGGKNWFWRVRAYNGLDFSGWSAARSFKMKLDAPLLEKPINSLVPALNEYTPTLEWKPVNGGVTYTLQVSRNNTFTSLVKNLTQAGTTYTFDTALTSKTTYYWRVKANGAAFASAWSTVYRFNSGTE